MNTTTARQRLRSDRGAVNPTTVMIGAAVVVVALWSHGFMAPVSGVIPGTSKYENQPGNDFAAGFANGYTEQKCKTTFGDYGHEDPQDCPWGQGDTYIEPEDRDGQPATEGQRLDHLAGTVGQSS